MAAASGAPHSFAVQVEGIGAFLFKRRNMRAQMAIETEYSRLTEGVPTPTEDLRNASRVVATLKVMALEVPAGWNVDELDPFDPQSAVKIKQVYEEFRLQEQFFRTGGGPERESPGPGDQPNP